jgi:hypothetical protein
VLSVSSGVRPPVTHDEDASGRGNVSSRQDQNGKEEGQLTEKNIDPKYRTPGKGHFEKPFANDAILTEPQYEATQQSMTV